MDKQNELLALLVKKNKIQSGQQAGIIKEAKEGKRSIEAVLIKKKIINEEEIAKLKAEIYKLPYIDLSEKTIGDEALRIISSRVAENYKVACFDLKDKAMKVGMVVPDNFKAIEAIDFLAKKMGWRAEYYLISETSFKQVFKQYKSFADELTSALLTRAEEEEEKVMTVSEKDARELSEITKSAPVAKIVSVIIRHAVEGGASDIHIEPMLKESRVRYRIDGILRTTLVLPRSVHAAVVARVKVMADLKLDETRIPQDGRVRLSIAGKEVDFRVSILPIVAGEKVVMRVLDVSKDPPTLPELGFQGQQLKVLEKNLEKTEGMLLATGPTGSGKSTTLFSILHIINKEGINIATLEDPVEYQVQGVNQSQIKPDIGYTFATGLRSFLRQDPDVIMVGEIRDTETAELAIHAALTGHYVLSTLHTTSAPGAITRLVDMKAQAFLLASTLHTVVGQRLARKICPHCKQEAKIPADQLKEVKEEIEKISEEYIRTIIKDFDKNKLTFYEGKGCPRCGNTGFTGRLSLVEVLDINEYLRDLIIQGKKYLQSKEVNASQKFITIKQDGIIKVLQGITSMKEILRVIES